MEPSCLWLVALQLGRSEQVCVTCTCISVLYVPAGGGGVLETKASKQLYCITSVYDEILLCPCRSTPCAVAAAPAAAPAAAAAVL
jgi:hypothetical protein